MARPPVCQERLAVTESGQVVVRFKNAWRNGAHAVVLDPLDFIARLVEIADSPDDIARVLANVGLGPRPPPRPRPAVPGQLELALAV